MVKEVDGWKCEECGEVWETEELANECEKTPHGPSEITLHDRKKESIKDSKGSD